MKHILDAIAPLCHSVAPVGSRVTCDPPPMDTDADYLCLVRRHCDNDFINLLELHGFKIGGSECCNDVNESRFMSWTHGEINIIATISIEFHRRFLAASSVAKLLNLMEKRERIALFQAVLYGNGVYNYDYAANGLCP